MDSYEFNIKEYEEATQFMSAVEEAMYGRLVRLYMRQESAIKGPMHQLWMEIRAFSDDEKAGVSFALDEFFTYREGAWHHDQCDALLKKARKGKVAGPRVSLPDWIPEDVWAEFVDMRKKVKAPLTDRAAQLLINKLETMMHAGQKPRAVLEQSIMNSWKGVFDVKAEQARGINFIDDRQAFNERENARAKQLLFGG